MSASTPDSGRPPVRPPAETILGYLNFSTGRPEPAVQRAWNTLFEEQSPKTWDDLHAVLRHELDRLNAGNAAFQDAAQARAVLGLVFDGVVPAYFSHHADLLFHLTPSDLLNPFFLSRICEALLAIGGPWGERDRIIAGSLNRLNDFVGHRPLAILESNQKTSLYPHERFRPIPLFLRDAGVATGPFHEMIGATLDHLAETPSDLLEEAGFDLAKLDELAIDVRAHDAIHPVFKRTNYLFGEWDPHLIDAQGYFRRFVIRRTILDALTAWMESAVDLPPAERLHDAAAVLCGTILMASAISGWGPAAHDSTTSLTSLLPIVAHQRDAFYARLMSRISGPRAARLKAVAEKSRQPFGHVRQHLNIYLANYAAAQMQRRAIAEQYARMGYYEAAREEASRIPAVSLRFECELDLRAEAAERVARRNGAAAADLLTEATDLLQRGIDCGAIIDPWNILGFQGQFPLFVAREDSVPDPRAEWLIDYMSRLLAGGSHVLTEAAAAGDAATTSRVYRWLEETATWWDRYATTTVTDLPEVSGAELTASASAVAATIAEWRAAGRAAGDLSFWQQRVDRLESPKAFADVVDAVLARGDFVASSGLLIQWLGRADEIGLGDTTQSFYDLSARWMKELTAGPGGLTDEEKARLGRRFFDFLEANAGVFWSVPAFGDPSLTNTGDDRGVSEPDTAHDDRDDEHEADDDNLFGAAYEGVVFRDSTADGFESSVMDSPGPSTDGEFEMQLISLEPRLRFLDLVAQLWRVAAARIDWRAVGLTDAVEQWVHQSERWRNELSKLGLTVARRSLGMGSGDLETNLEYDAQLQSRNHLLHLITGAAVRMASAERLLRSRLAERDANSGDDPAVRVLASLLVRDVVGLQRRLPALLRRLADEPLLYVAVENGGDPRKAIEARVNQDLLTTLVAELPRLGLLREARQVLRVALRMERRSRPAGLSVTEFDRLFRAGFESVLRTAIAARPPVRASRLRRNPVGHRSRGIATRSAAYRSMRSRSSAVRRFSRDVNRNDATVSIVGLVVEQFLDLWLQHASTMRLTAVEVFNDSATWSEARRFIHRYGNELFHARALPLSNLRTILHEGVEPFLGHLIENQDPLVPSTFVDAIERDEALRQRSVRMLELIYSAVVDEIERFIEYNSTTTQSDYGERFDSFLEFLRLEAAYRRDEWDLTPLRIAHEVLASAGEGFAARQWEQIVRERTSGPADKHLAKLAALEKRHAMRLPSISDHLAERFVKPFAVDRMLALVPLAVSDQREGQQESLAFRMLRREVDNYIQTSTGSAAELPDWIGKINTAVTRAVEGRRTSADERETLTARPIPRLRRGQILRQFARARRPRRRKP